MERLAALEHRKWMNWSLEITETEEISKERVERWTKLWRPYEELGEKEKEQDMELAEETLYILKKYLGIK